MRRYKIIIQYDGSFFNGWQLQNEKKTVQGEIENALKIITKSKNRIPIQGSGRTDSGVHAQGQVAHFDIDNRLTDQEFLYKLFQLLSYIRQLDYSFGFIIGQEYLIISFKFNDLLKFINAN